MSKRKQVPSFFITVIKDINEYYGTDGCERMIRADAIVKGTVKLATEEVNDNCSNTTYAKIGDVVDNTFPGTTITVTKIMTEDFGELMIKETVSEFEVLVNVCCGPTLPA